MKTRRKTPRRKLPPKKKLTVMQWAQRQFPNATPAELKNRALLAWLKKNSPLANERELRAVLIHAERLTNENVTALSIYEPSELQLKFHESKCFMTLLFGGNQCLGGETIIDGRRVDEIDQDFMVDSHCPETGLKQRRRSCKPFEKSFGRLYRVTLSNGQWFTASAGHRMLSESGEWISLSACAERIRQFGVCRLASSSELGPRSFPRDVPRSTQKAEDFQDCYSLDFRQCDEQPRLSSVAYQAAGTLSGDAPEYIPCRLSSDGLVDAPECSPTYQQSDHPSSLDVPSRLSGRGDAFESRASSPPYSPAFEIALVDRQSAEESFPHFHTRNASAQRANESWHDVSALLASKGGSGLSPREGRPYSLWPEFQFQARTVQPFSERQPCLSITSIDYIREGIIYDIQVDVNANYVLGGAIHHNSGKSLACAVEVARCALGRDPHGKYRKTNKRNPLIIFCVAYDAKSVGRRLHRYLFRWGAFDIIRDNKTGLWRPFNPDKDARRSKEKMPAPPLIPEYEVKTEAWTFKKAKQFDNFVLENGTEIYAFSSKGDSPQGDQVDLYWIDEDIADPDWIDEARPRLAARDGRLIWSALPKKNNEGLSDVLELANQQKHRVKPPPDCVAIQLSLMDNEYIAAKSRRQQFEAAAARGHDVLRLRIYGDPMGQNRLVYPIFNWEVHGLDRAELPGGNVPADWTRYLVTDPSRTRCGTLFAAVPPPHCEFSRQHGQIVLVYKEIVIRNCNAKIYGETIAAAAGNDRFWEWIIDFHYGRKQDDGPEPKKVHEYYQEALALNNMASIAHGAEFVPASDNIDANVEAVMDGLTVRRDGTVKLRFLREELPEFHGEIKKYYNEIRMVRGVEVVLGKPDKRRGLDLMDALEYLTAHDPVYVAEARKPARNKSRAVLRYEEKKRLKRLEYGAPHVVLG